VLQEQDLGVGGWVGVGVGVGVGLAGQTCWWGEDAR
jgi:hypothetical protein